MTMNKTTILQDLLLELASDASDEQLLAAIKALRERANGATTPRREPKRSDNGTTRTRHPTRFLIVESLKSLGRPSYVAEIVKEVRKREKGLSYQAINSALCLLKKTNEVCHEKRNGSLVYWPKP